MWPQVWGWVGEESSLQSWTLEDRQESGRDNCPAGTIIRTESTEISQHLLSSPHATTTWPPGWWSDRRGHDRVQWSLSALFYLSLSLLTQCGDWSRHYNTQIPHSRHISVTMRHISVTMRHISVTMGHISVTMRHICFTMGHISVTIHSQQTS